MAENASCSNPSGESILPHSRSHVQNTPRCRIQVLSGHLAPTEASGYEQVSLGESCTSAVPRKVVSASEAIAEIPDNAIVTVGTRPPSLWPTPDFHAFVSRVFLPESLQQRCDVSHCLLVSSQQSLGGLAASVLAVTGLSARCWFLLLGNLSFRQLLATNIPHVRELSWPSRRASVMAVKVGPSRP